METRYEAVINGVSLSSLDERIIVTDIREHEPETRVSAAERPVNAGSFLVRNKRTALSVTVAFVLWERVPAQRRALLDQVTGWALGDLLRLEVNQRPGQYLNVHLDKPPVIKSAMRWMDEITITFTAYEFPYWRDLAFVQVTTTYNEYATLQLPGNGLALVSALVTNTGTETISSVFIYVNNSPMVFSGIALHPGETLEIGYNERDILLARIGDVSQLEKRTADSVDDLVMQCGKPVGVIAGANLATISVVFMAQGVHE